MEVVITSTTKGKPLLKHGGFEYIQRKMNKDGSQCWRCIHSKMFKCPSSMTTSDGRIVRRPSAHTHETDLIRSEAKELTKRLKATVQAQPGVATRQLVARALTDVNDEVLVVLPQKSTLMNVVRRERRTIEGVQPNPLDRNFQVFSMYTLFRKDMCKAPLRCSNFAIQNLHKYSKFVLKFLMTA